MSCNLNFHRVAMFFFCIFWLKSSISITETPTHMKICMIVHIFFSWHVHCLVIFNPFTSRVTDRYQHKQCIIMETETETNMKVCMY